MHCSHHSKNFHSTEIALLKVHTDITPNINQSKVTTLTLLDLSDAFDIIYHNYAYRTDTYTAYRAQLLPVFLIPNR